MSLIPWGNRKTSGGDMSLLSDLRTEMNRVFDSFFREPFGAMTEAFGWQDQFAPSLDVRRPKRKSPSRQSLRESIRRTWTSP